MSDPGVPQFRAEFGPKQLRAMKKLLQVDPGGVAFEARESEFTVAVVGAAKIASTSVTFDTDAFEAYDVEQTGEESVSGTAFEGILSAVYQLHDRNSRTFELVLKGDTVTLQDTERGIGGSIPLGSHVDRPDVSDFEDKLKAEATVAAPAAARALYRDAKCSDPDGMAELAATRGTATLTMSGERKKRADLGQADHDYDQIGLWNAKLLTDAFLSFEHVNNETTVTWGSEYPVVLEMDDEDASYRAVVAPRIPDDDHTPLYKTADEVNSVDVVTAGGFK